MEVPYITGSIDARLLYSLHADEWQSPRSAADVISIDDMLPRDPWLDLAAGSSPKVVMTRTLVLSFVVAILDADHQSWHGYQLRDLFSLAMIQHNDGQLSASTAQAKVVRSELAAQNNLWVGTIDLEIVHARRLLDQPIGVRHE